MSKQIPLIVDLDGTLIKTDLFLEGLILFLKKNPFRIFKVVYWFLSEGRLGIKSKLSSMFELDFGSLPFNKNVVSWLQVQKENGRPLFLVTGSTQEYAERMGQFTGLFEECYGVNKERKRLTGVNKGRFLVNKFQHFDYIGNSIIDFHVWKRARRGIVGGASFLVQFLASIFFDIELVIKEQKTSLESLKEALALLKQSLWIERVCLFFLGVIFALGLSFLFHNLSPSNYLKVESFNTIFQFLFIYLLMTGLTMSAFLMNEWHSLYEDRIVGKSNVFKIFHPYWGLLSFFIIYAVLRWIYLYWDSPYFLILFFFYFVVELMSAHLRAKWKTMTSIAFSYFMVILTTVSLTNFMFLFTK